MDVNAATAWLVAAVVVFTLLAAFVAFKWSEREQRVRGPHLEPAEPLVPAGVGDVLSVLRSSAVLLDVADTVVKASPAAYVFGVVRGDRLAYGEILDMARKTRRDGDIREAELELPRGPLGRHTLSVSVRVAPLSSRLVLVLVEDRTEARRIDAIRRDFVANVSHELKTPIGALSLLAEAVMDASDDPEAVQRFAARMQYESSRLANLVQELINLSRLQNDDPLAQAEPVSISTVVEEALDRSRALANSKSIALVSGGPGDLRVLGDHAQLVMALGNLVENAVAYSPRDTRVAVGIRERGDIVEIAVTDQGIGIPERDLERIFERFYRVDPARSRTTGGTGLGLSIVKHIAASHGGDVTVWSQEGSGSTFTMRLPHGGLRRGPYGDAGYGDVGQGVGDVGELVDPAHNPASDDGTGPDDRAGSDDGAGPGRDKAASPTRRDGDRGIEKDQVMRAFTPGLREATT